MTSNLETLYLRNQITTMAKKELQALVAEQKILNKIYAIRGERVMLDRDLAGCTE